MEKNKRQLAFSLLAAIALCSAFLPEAGFALSTSDSLSRGEAVDMVVKQLDLPRKHKNFLRECDEDLEACFFTFSTRTNFDEMRLKPLILYPDVYPAYRYYQSINLATKLDLVRGYFEENDSPFRPEQPITQIEALKLVMGASNILSWKEKFELTGEDSEQTWLKLSWEGGEWWYGRYLMAAVENGFWQSISEKSVEDTVSKEEFLKLLENANRIVASGQTTSLVDNMADTYGQTIQKADASGNTAL